MLDAKIICHRFVSNFRVKKIHLLSLSPNKHAVGFHTGKYANIFPYVLF